MSEYVPTTEEIRQGWAEFAGFELPAAEADARFTRWLAEVERAAAEKAVAVVRAEIRGIPHWWNAESNYGEFDIQPLGPNETSEQGAFMRVMSVLDECAAVYRREETE